MEVDIAPNKLDIYAITPNGALIENNKLEIPKTESPAPIVSKGFASKALKEIFVFLELK